MIPQRLSRKRRLKPSLWQQHRTHRLRRMPHRSWQRDRCTASLPVSRSIRQLACRRPVAVMINNIEEATPQQCGTSQADVLYEAVVEAILPVCLPSSRIPQKLKRSVLCAAPDIIILILPTILMQFTATTASRFMPQTVIAQDGHYNHQ